MRRRLLGFLLFSLAMVAGAAAQHKHEASPSLHISCAPLLNGVGDINHPVSTKNPGPERFFNQGFSLSNGFHHLDADRAFVAWKTESRSRPGGVHNSKTLN
jgi:hypothetical protein